MSILYEALQKARKEREKIKQPVSEGEPEDLFSQYQEFDREQSRALLQELEPKNFFSKHLFAILKVFFPILLLTLGLFYMKHQKVQTLQKTSDQTYRSSLDLGKRMQGSSGVILNAPSVGIRNPLEAVPYGVQTKGKGVADRFRDVVIQKIVKTPEFRVTGIIVDESGNYCFLNGLIARVGDVIDNARVLEIGTREVFLDYKGKKVRVPLPEL